jgi:hypothetical protein
MSPDFQCGNPIPKAVDLNTRRDGTFPAQSPQSTDFRRTWPAAVITQHDEHVIQMNGFRRCASDRVQRAAARVAGTIDENRPSRPGAFVPVAQETTMLKIISAALLAVSVLAAPALANSGRTAAKPAVKSVQLKPSVRNANASIGGHHHKHFRLHRYHHIHKH